jgi:hypothetical protein
MTTRLTKQLTEAIVRMIMDDVPRLSDEDMEKEIRTRLFKIMPPEVSHAECLHPGSLNSRSWWFEYELRCNANIPVGNLTDDQIDTALADLEEACKARNAAQKRLEGTIKGYRSVESLLKAMPEFEKYLTPLINTPSTNLPALANVTAELAKLGWPKKGTS